MNVSQQEWTAARTALSCAFERLWPDPACPCPKPEPPCLQEIETLEQHYLQASRMVSELTQDELTQDEQIRMD